MFYLLINGKAVAGNRTQKGIRSEMINNFNGKGTIKFLCYNPL